MTKKNSSPRTSASAPKKRIKFFPIVAIGASAGGLEAAKELFKKLPADTGMAYIYIQHLDPSHESMLASILGKVTKMKVQEARNLMQIKPDNVYVIPSGKDMSIINGVLTTQQRKAKPALHMPIDQFFISLAEKQQEGAVGIVLSGTASDGTAGLKAIKLYGGLTMAQDESAEFQSMPRSAIAEGVVDMVLSPIEMARELERLSKQSNIFQEAINDDLDESIFKDEDILNILMLVKKSTSVDFTHYKRKTIKRRIIRRMLLYRLDDLKNYAKYLKQHTSEITLLYQDLLINVTSFFRDMPAMEYLRKSLLPRIIKSKAPGEPIRIWVPACSTGEEAYSLAILLIEVLGERANNTSIQIFATDLSENAIAKARLGLYSKNDLQNITPKRLQRFFTRVDNGYRIVKAIRDLCVFAPHNVFKDPPFSRIDLISCCNLLIYLDTILQKKLIATFHYALNNNGYLVLGKSETIGTSAQLFMQPDKKYKIYARKKDAASRAVFEMNYRGSETERAEPVLLKKMPEKETEKTIDLDKEIDNILLSRYVPASVVVNQDLEVLQFKGSTGLFLEHLPGKASLNLLKMARAEVAFDLRSTIHKATRLGKPIKKSGLEIKHKGTTHQVSIEVVPLNPDGIEKLFLVVFEEVSVPAASEISATLSRDRLIKKLQEELNNMREDMRGIVEEQEASNEELQSANEEIVSSNEELQSINEELETSKEEIESANEELMTINQELQVRNEQLAEAYDYAEAFFYTIREAIIVLDSDLRVKTANHSFYQIFKVKKEDTEGRFIYELGNHQWDIPRLRELLDTIIPQNTHFYGYEVTHRFPTIGEKIMMLNARKIIQKIHRQHLILLAIEDITEHRQAERVLQEREAWIRNMADNAPVMIWVTDANKRVTFFNKTWLEYTSRKPELEMGTGWMDGIHPDDRAVFLQQYNAHFNERKPFSLEFRLLNNAGEYRWILNSGKPDFNSDASFRGYIVSCTEIHDKKLMQQELEKRVQERTHDLQQINRELERSNSELQQFAYVASHDLQEPLRKIMTFSDRLQQHFGNELPEKGNGYIEKIIDSSQRMTRLIDDLLNFSKITRPTESFKRTDLNTIMKNVLDDFEEIIKDKKAKVEYDKLPAIHAIPVQMEQLFHNLVSNGLKFTGKAKQPLITITARPFDKSNISRFPRLNANSEYQEIIVQDNGIGFSAEYADQIFIIFQRLNDKQEFPGTGIGLALCRKIVNNHNGEIFAESKEGKGAAFHVVLPVNQ
jgi:two-component system CheB/CheR fusion protein